MLTLELVILPYGPDAHTFSSPSHNLFKLRMMAQKKGGKRISAAGERKTCHLTILLEKSSKNWQLWF